MWSVIKKSYDNEYDVIPNSWLQSETTAYFPSHIRNITQITKMVKNADEYDLAWELIEMSIKKKNYESFERAMNDTVRFSKNKKSISSSENEAKQKRISKKPVFSDNESSVGTKYDSDQSYLSDKEDDRIYQAEAIPLPPTSLICTSSGQYSPLHNKENGLKTTPKKLITTQKCKIAKGKTHCCAFETNYVSLESLGHTLCGISRQIERLNNIIKNNNAEFTSRINELKLSNNEMAVVEEILVDSDEEASRLELLQILPFTDFEQLKQFDEKLKLDRDYYQNIVTALQAKTTKKSYIKAARSIMNQLLAPKLCSKLSWKGISRKDQAEKKEAFKDLQCCHMLFRIIKKLFPKIREEEVQKIETSLSNWLAQTGSFIKTTDTDV